MTDKYFVSGGPHEYRRNGRCAMEWVAYLAGEKHSDHPQCVCPVLTSFCIALNDALSEENRQKLRPYLARTIGTHDDGLLDRRFQMCEEFQRAHNCEQMMLVDHAWNAGASVVGHPERIPLAFELLERMLPTEIIELPAVGLEEASLVCGVAVS